MSKEYQAKAAAKRAAATVSLEKAKTRLSGVVQRLQALEEEHSEELTTLTELLKEEGLVDGQKTLKRGPLSLCTHLYAMEVDVLTMGMNDVFIELSKAGLAVKAAEAVLRQV